MADRVTSEGGAKKEPTKKGLIEWRYFRGWSEQELLPRLALARTLPRNFPDEPEKMSLETGWSQVRSVSRLGREEPGPPAPDGLFERARAVFETFDFSDPRIVRWHFKQDEPLRGRAVLLELKSLDEKLRFLCAVRVGGTRLERGEKCSIYGFSFETLAGHIEAGCEWFLLQKDHASGEVSFTIEASWRPGQFPNWWTRLGFSLVGRRYQRAWHRLTHVRVRELARHRPELVGKAAHSGALEHSGHEVETAPVQFFAQPAQGRHKTKVHEEVEAVSRGLWLTPLGLGVLAGMRSMSAPTLVSRRLAEAPGPLNSGLARTLAKPWVPQALGLLALGELVVDKLPMTPARVKAVPLAGRIFAGALAAAASVAGSSRGRTLAAAALGATTAVVSAWAFFELRTLVTRRLKVPAVAAGLAEDSLVGALASRLMPVVSGASASA
ncbi:DUF1990 family protein [Aggregicoccus sp. 17bor-14]|uniref:DUF1990 family protein n=1 Tax=Myxococcaceae TaxID=31 RepID=UPI00129C7674|nr:MULTISPECIES: DUF1990 family protein [Myxococcaceae]MBF5045152.1 DUF1990 family protein [Simulacricoccus sp. 17bor-14]MRI90894.1 DUF1990 family protein [Aggregicoccus sp. 17bor-14]